MDDDAINTMTKSLLNESWKDCGKTGLAPFYTLNKAPDVSILNNFPIYSLSVNLLSHSYFEFRQADSSFWEKKLQDKPAKKARTKNKAVKKPAKKKTNTSEQFSLDDDESEVELDSLGSFLYILLTMITIRMTRKAATQMVKR